MGARRVEFKKMRRKMPVQFGTIHLGKSSKIYNVPLFLGKSESQFSRKMRKTNKIEGWNAFLDRNHVNATVTEHRNSSLGVGKNFPHPLKGQGVFCVFIKRQQHKKFLN